MSQSEPTSDAAQGRPVSLPVPHSVVAHRRDFVVAQSLGMDPRFVDELRPKTNPQKQPLKPRFGISTGPEIDTVSLPMAAAAPV